MDWRSDTTSKRRTVRHQAAPLRSKVVIALRTGIETGLLQPGVRLIERDLCEQLNVSRTSLREALRELEGDGILVQTDRGLAVEMLTRRDAENTYRIRATLEALLVEQFIQHADQAEVVRLNEDGSALKAAYKSGDVPLIIAAKRAFYDRICIGAQNEIAFDIINRLVLRTSSLRVLSVVQAERQEESIKEIDLILRAIRKRDVDQGRKAATRHVENFAAAALSEYAEVPIETLPKKATAPGRGKTERRVTN